MLNNIPDRLWMGLIAGLLAPTIGIALFYASNFSTADFSEFFRVSVEEKLLSPLLSLCVVINLGVFYGFIHLEKYMSARGIILATFMYGLAIVVLKFFV